MTHREEKQRTPGPRTSNGRTGSQSRQSHTRLHAPTHTLVEKQNYPFQEWIQNSTRLSYSCPAFQPPQLCFMLSSEEPHLDLKGLIISDCDSPAPCNHTAASNFPENTPFNHSLPLLPYKIRRLPVARQCPQPPLRRCPPLRHLAPLRPFQSRPAAHSLVSQHAVQFGTPVPLLRLFPWTGIPSFSTALKRKLQRLLPP